MLYSELVAQIPQLAVYTNEQMYNILLDYNLYLLDTGNIISFKKTECIAGEPAIKISLQQTFTVSFQCMANICTKNMTLEELIKYTKGLDKIPMDNQYHLYVLKSGGGYRYMRAVTTMEGLKSVYNRIIVKYISYCYLITM